MPYPMGAVCDREKADNLPPWEGVDDISKRRWQATVDCLDKLPSTGDRSGRSDGGEAILNAAFEAYINAYYYGGNRS